MSEKVYPKGLRTFPPHANAPEFVKGSLIITLNELIQFCKDNPDYLTEYNGQKQLKCSMLDGDKGLYLNVDTYRPDVNSRPEPQHEVDGNLDSEPPLPF